jgi:hypothetical protein
MTIGYVYKIVCNDPEIKDCYVGSCTVLAKRKCSHKSNCNNSNSKEYNMNVYQFIRAHGGWNNWSMLAIEQVNYSIKHELLVRERFNLERLKATLNKQIPTRTKQEYKQAYYEANKEAIIEAYKIYQEANKEQISEAHKIYYQANKESLKQLIECDCGKSSTKSHILRHQKSKKHKQYEYYYNFIYHDIQV